MILGADGAPGRPVRLVHHRRRRSARGRTPEHAPEGARQPLLRRRGRSLIAGAWIGSAANKDRWSCLDLVARDVMSG